MNAPGEFRDRGALVSLRCHEELSID